MNDVNPWGLTERERINFDVMMRLSPVSMRICVLWGDRLRDGPPHTRERVRLGTAFPFLRPDWFVTAKHVVHYQANEGHLQAGLPRADLWVAPRGAGQQELAARVIWAHETIDLAMLEVDGGGVEPFQVARNRNDLVDRRMMYWAYAPGATAANSGPTFRGQVIHDAVLETREGGELETRLRFPAPLGEGGNSGGPLVAEDDGGVLAVISESPNATGQVVATSIVPVLNVLHFP